ncbi:MAG: HEAT repeat domain-containing protein [Desulfobacterales bacterium]|nr:HEAT repeat domain-containing protein [Desulfobacterales bacterium]
MVVVLAGMGKQSVLRTLALHDPDDAVRGTSIQYLMHTTDETETGNIDLIIELLEKDRSPIVKHSILVNWDFDQHQMPVGLLLNCAINKSGDVRLAAIKQIVKQYDPHEVASADIVKCLANQISKDMIYMLSDWLLTAKLHDILISAANRAQPPTIIIILDFIADRDLKFSWDRMQTLSGRKNPDIDIRILESLQMADDVGLISWLAFGVARAITLPKAEYHAQFLEQRNAANFYHVAMDPFLKLVKESPAPKMAVSDKQNFKTILNHLENELDYFSSYDDEDYWEDEEMSFEEYAQEMTSNCDTLKKWLHLNISRQT